MFLVFLNYFGPHLRATIGIGVVLAQRRHPDGRVLDVVDVGLAVDEWLHPQDAFPALGENLLYLSAGENLGNRQKFLSVVVDGLLHHPTIGC